MFWLWVGCIFLNHQVTTTFNEQKHTLLRKHPLLESRRSLIVSGLRREGNEPTSQISPPWTSKHDPEEPENTHNPARSLTTDRGGKTSDVTQGSIFPLKLSDFSLTPEWPLLLFQAKLALRSPQKLTLCPGLLPQTHLKHAPHAGHYTLFSYSCSGWPPTSLPKQSQPFLKTPFPLEDSRRSLHSSNHSSTLQFIPYIILHLLCCLCFTYLSL